MSPTWMQTWPLMIRELKISDIDDCIEIINANYGKEYLNIFKKEFWASFEDTWIVPKYIGIEIDRKITSFAGYSLLPTDHHSYGIFWVNTHPYYTGKGHSKNVINKIIEEIKSLSKEKNHGQIILSCSEELSKFYSIFGFNILIKRNNKGGYIMGMNIYK